MKLQSRRAAVVPGLGEDITLRIRDYLKLEDKYRLGAADKYNNNVSKGDKSEFDLQLRVFGAILPEYFADEPPEINPFGKEYDFKLTKDMTESFGKPNGLGDRFIRSLVRGAVDEVMEYLLSDPDVHSSIVNFGPQSEVYVVCRVCTPQSTPQTIVDDHSINPPIFSIKDGKVYEEYTFGRCHVYHEPKQQPGHYRTSFSCSFGEDGPPYDYEVPEWVWWNETDGPLKVIPYSRAAFHLNLDFKYFKEPRGSSHEWTICKEAIIKKQ